MQAREVHARTAEPAGVSDRSWIVLVPRGKADWNLPVTLE
jgi:hypothetical protein